MNYFEKEKELILDILPDIEEEMKSIASGKSSMMQMLIFKFTVIMFKKTLLMTEHYEGLKLLKDLEDKYDLPIDIVEPETESENVQ